MSRKGQTARSTDPEDYQQVPRAVAAMPKDFADGFEIAPHRHRRAQLIYATAGTMRISTEEAVWVVPPQRALWMPPGVRHSIAMSGDVTMRTLYLRQDAATGMPDICRVLHISPLLRELIVRATEMPVHYDERGAAGHVVALILDELHREPSLPLNLPMPRDPDYFHKVVDCQWACPGPHPRARIHPPDRAGRYSDAYMVNWVSNVFPGILGRTCDRPCEPACRRGRVEEEQRPGRDLPPEARRRRLQGRRHINSKMPKRRPRTASAWPASAPVRPR
jgi:quercetin dioxygenase-like cupin family protein